MSDDEDKINALFHDSDDEVQPPAEPSSAAEALERAGLGSDDDEPYEPRQASPDQAEAGPDDFRRDDEEEGPSGPQRPRLDPITWDAPLTTRPRHHLHVVNFKSLVGIEAQPFNPEKFELDSIESQDQMGRRRVKASALNRIRWRWTGNVEPDGTLERESNARFVRWSDGSLQIFVGDDVLDVSEQDIEDQNMTLCVWHEACKLLQAQAQVGTRFLLKPHELSRKLQRNLAFNLAPASKEPKVKLNAVIKDYERETQLLAQQEEARLKLEKKQEKVMRKSNRNYAAFGGLGRKARGGGLTAEALEAHDSDLDEEEEADDQGGRRYNPDEEEEREKRLLAAKREAPSSLSRKRRFLDDEDDFDMQLSDDDPADAPQPSTSKSSKKRFIMDDDDDDDVE